MKESESSKSSSSFDIYGNSYKKKERLKKSFTISSKFSPQKRAMLLSKKLISREGSEMSEEMSLKDSFYKRSNTAKLRPINKEKAPLFEDIIPDDAKL